MKSNGSYLKRHYSAGLPVFLLLLLTPLVLTHAGLAQTVETPATVSPALPAPDSPSPPSNGSTNSGSNESAPSPSINGSETQDSVQTLQQRGIIGNLAVNRDTVLNRAEFAEILVNALKHNTALVSEFPVYRDVPLTHPHYAAIEVARHKRLLTMNQDHGFYHPEAPITFQDVYLALSQAITGKVPEHDRAVYLLRNIPDAQTLAPETASAVAKMAQSRFFTRTRRYQTTYHPPDQSVTLDSLAPYIEFMLFLNERRGNLALVEETLPDIPGGLRLLISPATGIMEERLKSSGRFRFQLLQTVETLPRGSTLRGSVLGTSANRTYQILFDSLRTPEGKTYELNATLEIAFTSKDKLGFVVPGESFEIITQPVSSNASGSALPPPMTPPPNTGNQNILQQPAKTIPK